MGRNNLLSWRIYIVVFLMRRAASWEQAITLTMKFADLHIKEEWTVDLGGGLRSLSAPLVLTSNKSLVIGLIKLSKAADNCWQNIKCCLQHIHRLWILQSEQSGCDFKNSNETIEHFFAEKPISHSFSEYISCLLCQEEISNGVIKLDMLFMLVRQTLYKEKKGVYQMCRRMHAVHLHFWVCKSDSAPTWIQNSKCPLEILTMEQ